ncbi:MAG: hypothetical protein ACMXYG_02620 [Candidatus Woesearchaeota archaeon]
MLDVQLATLDDIPGIQELSLRQHLLSNSNNWFGFVFSLFSERELKIMVETGLTKVLKSDDNVVGYILGIDDNAYFNIYGIELQKVLEENYHVSNQGRVAYIAQANIDGSYKSKIDTLTIQRQITSDLFDTGIDTIYATGALHPFNPRTYYILSKLMGWNRKGFNHIRFDKIPYDIDAEQLERLGGLLSLRSSNPDGVIFGLYEKRKP